MRAALVALALAAAAACKPAGGPIADADAASVVEAGAVVANDVCSLIEGVDSNGTIRTICATIEEIAQIAVFILTLRTADAGAPAGCTPLPKSTVCATSAERAKAVLFVANVRAARLSLDGGAR